MMTIHKEGTATISLIAIFVGVLNILNFSYLFPVSAICAWVVFIITVAFFLFIVSFFRMPVRALTISDDAIVSPADGKVVVIEEVEPDEFYKEKKNTIKCVYESCQCACEPFTYCWKYCIQ